MQGVTPIARKAGKHMALKKVVQSLEEVAEKFRSLYEELEGGGFGLTSELEVEGLVSAASVEGLVKNKEEILAELKKLKTTYKDVDPEKYAALLKENEEKERERQKLAGDFDTRDKQLTEKHARELAALNEKIGGLTVSLNQQLVDNAAREALVAAKAKAKGGISLLMPHIKTSTRVEEIDGRHVVRVMGPDGHARPPRVDHEPTWDDADHLAILPAPADDTDGEHARGGAHDGAALVVATPREPRELIGARHVRVPDGEQVLGAEVARTIDAEVEVAHGAVGQHDLHLRAVLLHGPEARVLSGARAGRDGLVHIVDINATADAATETLLLVEDAADVVRHPRPSRGAP